MGDVIRTSQRLGSWKEIATYLRVSVRTAQRWERQESLPVHRHEHPASNTVYGYTSEIDQWFEQREQALPSRGGAARWGLAALVLLAAVLLFRLPGGKVGADGAHPEAYEAYLRGRYIAHEHDLSRLPAAVRLLEQAVEADPGFALGWAVLAEREGWISYRNDVPLPPKVTAAMHKALALDPRLAEAHVNIGDLEFYWNWNWAKGEAAFRRAIELDPGSSDALLHYAMCQSALGRNDEAIRTMDRVRRVEPLAPFPMMVTGAIFYRAGKPAKAIENLRAALELAPGHSATQALLASVLAETGRESEAVELSLKSEEGRGLDRQHLPHLRGCFAQKGYQAFMAELLDLRLQRLERKALTERVSPVVFASTYATLGRRDQAFGWLEKAYIQRCPTLAWLKANRDWDPLRSDPRYREMLDRMMFPR